MKVLFILSALLVASAQANFFGDLGASLKNVFSTLGGAVMHELDTTGVQLLNAGLSAGKGLVSQGVQALALNTANALANKDQTRDVDPSEVEAALHGMIDLMGGSLKAVFKQFGGELGQIVEKVGEMKISPEELVSEVDKLVKTHNVFADAVLKAIESKAGEVITGMVPHHKRNAFTDFFSGIGTSLSTAFQPMVDGVKNMATSAGSLIKTGGTALLSAAKESAAQLGTKLQPHLAALGNSLGTIAQHGANALTALKAASGDILQQTLSNMQQPLTDMANTVQNAGQTVVQHVAGTLGATTQA